jgi:hypothetical protein
VQRDSQAGKQAGKGDRVSLPARAATLSMLRWRVLPAPWQREAA